MAFSLRKYRPFLAPILVLAGGMIIPITLWTGLLPDQLITIRVDLGNTVFMVGLLVSLPWMAVKYAWGQSEESAKDLVKMEAADEKRRFLRRLDHELKNPLTAIRAGLANLEETSLDESQRQVLFSLEAQALRLSRLSSDLRKLAELETRPLERATVDLNELLHEARSVASDLPLAVGKDIKLTVPQAPWPLPSIQGDRDLLFLAVHNLLDNAIKFTQPGGTIEMRGFEDGSFLVIEVADTGQGIPQDELAHVGEELYRGRNARGIPGNGLGLALVHSIITLHGGKVTVRSREGKGTVITLRLPVTT
jgi:two-component system, OmpR family, sensor kinase